MDGGDGVAQGNNGEVGEQTGEVGTTNGTQNDYGLFENRQDRKMQFFIANRFPLLPGQNSANLGGKRAKNQNLNPPRSRPVSDP